MRGKEVTKKKASKIRRQRQYSHVISDLYYTYALEDSIHLYIQVKIFNLNLSQTHMYVK